MKVLFSLFLGILAITWASKSLAQTCISSCSGSGQWHQNSGARINRHNDRDLLGGATDMDGNSPDTALDWLSSLQTKPIASGGSVGIPLANESAYASQLVVENRPSGVGGNTTSHIAATVGSHSFAVPNASGIEGLAAYCYNDNTSYATSCWGIYSEAKKLTAASGPVYGIEIDAGSNVATSSSDPFQQGNVIGIQNACGGEYPLASTGLQVNCSAAVQIEANPASFKQGIVIGSGAIVPGGFSLSSPSGLRLGWYSAAGTVEATLGDVSGVMTSSNPVATPAIFASGNVPTPSGTCTMSNQIGGNTAGTFKFSGNCSAGTVILTFLTSAPNGWSCFANNRTNNTNIQQTADGLTTATFKASASNGDIINFSCTAY